MTARAVWKPVAWLEWIVRFCAIGCTVLTLVAPAALPTAPHLGRPVDREERHDHAVVAESQGDGDGILSFERRRELVGAKTPQ